MQYDAKTSMLKICYGATHQKTQVRSNEIVNQAYRIADSLEVGKLMNVRFSQETATNQLQAYFISVTICRASLFGLAPICTDTVVPVLIG